MHCHWLPRHTLQFLHNVSINLKDGGYFVGTVPDGRRINECIKKYGGCLGAWLCSSALLSALCLYTADERLWTSVPACSGRTYKRPMLTIEAHWVGGPGPFNSPYVCAIGDTVTGGEVWPNALLCAARLARLLQERTCSSLGWPVCEPQPVVPDS